LFIDLANIDVVSGAGGDGCISFRREKFVAKGGPDGGDGGRGGDVVFEVNPHLRTLLTFRHQNQYSAEPGRGGMGKQMFGRDGEDCVIQVPRGTLVEEENGRPVADLVEPGQRVVVARGGRGGKGNVHFKSATRRVPRIATDGQKGEAKRLKLTLKLLADVGLVGLPNVGKSTLMKRISNATPRVADYQFTTIRPNLGIVELPDFKSIVVADLPGLIEGASEGKGLGHQFLRHVERTRVLVFLIDSASPRPQRDLQTLFDELSAFRPALLERPRVLCYSRSDLVVGQELPELGGDEAVVRLSAHTGEGVPDLIRKLAHLSDQLDREEGLPPSWIDVEREEAASGDLALFADQVAAGGQLDPPWPRTLLRDLPESGVERVSPVQPRP